MVRTITFAAALALLALVVAAAPPAKVGALGDPSVIVYEGNEAFTDKEIRDGLAWSPDFWVAAHPDAELARFADDLRGLMREGYRHAGFPHVEIAVTPEPAKDRILVTVKEGTRYTAGEPGLTGMEGPEAEKLSTGFLVKLSELGWERDEPAMVDRATLEQFRRTVGDLFAERGRHSAKFRVDTVLDDEKKTVRPVIRIEDLGGPGVVAVAEVRGLKQHTPEHILSWLGVEAGQPADSGALESLRERLERSGRFAEIAVRTEPFEDPAKGVRLVLDLVETRTVPLLGEELPPELQAMLRFQKWATSFAGSEEELVAVVHGYALVVGSPRRGLILDLDLRKLDRPQHYTALLGLEELVFISRLGRVVLRAPRGDSTVVLNLLLGVVTDDPERSLSFRASAGLTLKEDEAGGVRFNFGGPPAAFLTMALRADECRIEEGKLLLVKGAVRFEIEAATGRLISVKSGDEENPPQVRIRVTSDEFERVWKRLDRVPDGYLGIAGSDVWFGEALGFIALDLLRRGPGTGGDSAILEKVFRASVRDSLTGIPGGKRGGFGVPRSWSIEGREGLADPELIGLLLSAANLLFPRGSWPRDVGREAALVFSGQGMRTGLVLSRLYESNEVGPLGYLTIASLLDTMGSPATNAFAKKGLSIATPEAFERDVAVLVDQGGALGRYLQHLAAAVRGLSPEDRTALGAILSEANRTHLVALFKSWDATKGLDDRAAAAAALRYLYQAGLGEWMRQSLETLVGE